LPLKQSQHFKKVKSKDVFLSITRVQAPNDEPI
jgi:hypothetical protein